MNNGRVRIKRALIFAVRIDQFACFADDVDDVKAKSSDAFFAPKIDYVYQLVSCFLVVPVKICLRFVI